MMGGLHLCGPFLSASVAIDRFGQNIYQANLLNEAIDMYAEYENKLKAAEEDNMDEMYIKSLQAESDYYEQIFRISLAGVMPSDDVS